MPTVQMQIYNYSIQNKTSGVVDVHIDGDIVDSPSQEMLKNIWGDETSVSYKSFRNQIETLAPKTVNVFINSTGGHVGDALAIHDYLKDLESNGTVVNRIGRGIIASAATLILMGKNSEMSKNSHMIIHNVRMFAFGDIEQVKNQVKTGEIFNNTIKDLYATETGNPPETIAAWMNKETVMNAEMAFERKFVKNKPTPEAEFTNSISKDKWQFENTDVLRIYNSYVHDSSHDNKHNSHDNIINMNTQKILDAIKNSYSDLLKAFGKESEKDTPVIKDALDAFSNSIVTAISENSVTETRVQEMITNSTTNLVKAEDIKENVSLTQLTAALEAQKDTLIAAINGVVGKPTSTTVATTTTEKKKGFGQKTLTNKYDQYDRSEWEAQGVLID